MATQTAPVSEPPASVFKRRNQYGIMFYTEMMKEVSAIEAELLGEKKTEPQEQKSGENSWNPFHGDVQNNPFIGVNNLTDEKYGLDITVDKYHGLFDFTK